MSPVQALGERGWCDQTCTWQGEGTSRSSHRGMALPGICWAAWLRLVNLPEPPWLTRELASSVPHSRSGLGMNQDAATAHIGGDRVGRDNDPQGHRNGHSDGINQ